MILMSSRNGPQGISNRCPFRWNIEQGQTDWSARMECCHDRISDTGIKLILHHTQSQPRTKTYQFTFKNSINFPHKNGWWWGGVSVFYRSCRHCQWNSKLREPYWIDRDRFQFEKWRKEIEFASSKLGYEMMERKSVQHVGLKCMYWRAGDDTVTTALHLSCV